LGLGPAEALLGFDKLGYLCGDSMTSVVVRVVLSCMFTEAPVKEGRMLVLVLHVLAVSPPNHMDVKKVLAICLLWVLGAFELRARMGLVEEAAYLLFRQIRHGPLRWDKADRVEL
jgi:hypothetical protein